MNEKPKTITQRFASSAGHLFYNFANGNGLTTKDLSKEFGGDQDIIDLVQGGRNLLPEDNFDDLVGRKGIEIYADMMKDAQVRMAIEQKRFAVISADWTVKPASDSAKDIEIAEFCEKAFHDVEGSIVGVNYELLSAIYNGYAISEMNYRVVEGGRFNGKWTFKSIRNKNIDDYEFEVDDFGNVTGLLYQNDFGTPTPMPFEKFIIYTYNPEFNRVYGRSDLRAVYKHWWSKDKILKFLNMYLERFGSPLRVGKYPSGQKGKRTDLLNVLKRLTVNSSAVFPDDLDIQFITDGRMAGDGFQKAIDYHDDQISKGILHQTLSSSEGRRTGSLALGNVHQETKEDAVTYLRKDLSELINERIIKTLIDLNYGKQEAYPKYLFQPRKGKIQFTTIDDAIKYFQSGMMTKDDFNIIRQRLDLPPVEGFDEELLIKPAPKAAPPAFSADNVIDVTPIKAEFQEIIVDDGKGESWIKITETENEFRARIKEPGQFQDGSFRSIQISDGVRAIIGKLMGAEKTTIQAYRFDKQAFGLGEAKAWLRRNLDKSNNSISEFAAGEIRTLTASNMTASEKRLGGVSWYQDMNKRLVKEQDALVSLLSKEIKVMQSIVQKFVKKNVLVDNGVNRQALDKLKLPQTILNNIQKISSEWLNDLTNDNYVRGLRETNANPKGIPAVADFARLDITPIEGVPVEATLQVDSWVETGQWAKVRAYRAKRLADLGGTHQSMAKFWITDVVETEVLKDVKTTIIAGMLNGQSTADIVTGIRETFEKWGANPELVTPARLETIARTNTTRAFADARRLAFTDPEVQDEFPASMFSAILDDRTSAICESLDSFIARNDDAIWSRITPPMHFNCRSTIVPVMADEFKEKGNTPQSTIKFDKTTKDFGGTA